MNSHARDVRIEDAIIRLDGILGRTTYDNDQGAAVAIIPADITRQIHELADELRRAVAAVMMS